MPSYKSVMYNCRSGQKFYSDMRRFIEEEIEEDWGCWRRYRVRAPRETIVVSWRALPTGYSFDDLRRDFMGFHGQYIRRFNLDNNCHVIFEEVKDYRRLTIVVRAASEDWLRRALEKVNWVLAIHLQRAEAMLVAKYDALYRSLDRRVK